MSTDEGDDKKDDKKPESKVALAKEAGGPHLLIVGFLCFGAILGYIGGASSHTGVSSTLLTSLCTFVGGSLLTFGGFVLGVKGDVAYLSGRRLGGGLIAFSLGVGGGLWGGSALRRDEVRSARKENRPADTLVHSNLKNACDFAGDVLAEPDTGDKTLRLALTGLTLGACADRGSGD
jgi:hypothetical protein